MISTATPAVSLRTFYLAYFLAVQYLLTESSQRKMKYCGFGPFTLIYVVGLTAPPTEIMV